MRLSEAIRLGSMLHPQAFGAYATNVTTSTVLGQVIATEVRTCAYGAAWIAVGNSVERCLDVDALMEFPDEWDEFTALQIGCPGCEETYPGDELIFHLNDLHRWPREKIAGLVESIERQPVTTVSPELTISVTREEELTHA